MSVVVTSAATTNGVVTDDATCPDEMIPTTNPDKEQAEAEITDDASASNEENGNDKHQQSRPQQLDESMEESSKTFEELSAEAEAQTLRRSQRASARRAQQKIRGEPTNEQEEAGESSALDKEEAVDEDLDEEPPSKKLRLVDAATLDTTDPHLAIKVTDDDQVAYASDESVVSTLNSHEVEFLRKNFNKLTSKELTEEQHVERDRMIQEIKAQLRIEESQMALLKKMRARQRMPVPKEPAPSSVPHMTHVKSINQHQNVRIPQQAANIHPPPAYRPPQAAAPVKSTFVDPKTAKPNQVVNQTQNKLVSSQNFVGRPLHGSQSHTNFVGKVEPSKVNQSNSSSRSTLPTSASMQNVMNVEQQQTPAQRQAAAKLALRKQLEKTLLQIPPPRPPPADLQFVPNPNQLEFVTLVGLDEIVERIMCNKIRHLTQKAKKEATANGEQAAEAKENKKPAEVQRNYGPVDVFNEPFSCVQCGTDFTPTWKRDGGRIKCEQCYRNNKKKSLKVEHTNRLKHAFVKALQQEQEIERQINEGTFNMATLQMNAASTPSAAPKTTNHVDVAPPAVHYQHKQQTQPQNHQQKQQAPQPPPKQVGKPTSSRSTGASSSNVAPGHSRNQAAPVAQAAAMAAYPAAAAQLMANLNQWNQLMAASRFQHPSPQQAAAAAMAMGVGLPQAWMQNMQNLPTDFVKTFQQLQQQQLNATLQQQQKLLRDALARSSTQKWK